jgi:alcohol dehydrogenase (cytochrome c)
VALDAKSGSVVWDVEVADYRTGYSITAAPLAIQDKIIVGISGGEYGIRGFLDAYDAKTGERLWRFYTIPGPGDPGHETWEGDSWKTGGAPTWVTGSFDPQLNLIYWGTGNPSPDFNGEVRKGDNLFSSSVIALDANTGKLKWHFQFTPHDVHDWDACQIPVLVDREFRGRQRKLLFWGNRNAFFYVLDRETGEFLLAREFAKQTWAERINSKGRPVRRPGMLPSPEGTLVYPGIQGGTNWYSPSYNPQTGLFYLSVWELPNIFFLGEAIYDPGTFFYGSLMQGASEEEPGWGAVRALVPETGDIKWEYRLHTVPWSGILSTAGDLAFSGTTDGQFFALDAYTGKELWVTYLGGMISASPISYLSEGKQQISIAAGSALFTFALE